MEGTAANTSAAIGARRTRQNPSVRRAEPEPVIRTSRPPVRHVIPFSLFQLACRIIGNTQRHRTIRGRFRIHEGGTVEIGEYRIGNAVAEKFVALHGEVYAVFGAQEPRAPEAILAIGGIAAI